MPELTKIAMIYYSGTGNTERVCKNIAATLKDADVKFFNVLSNERLSAEEFDVIGFAFPTFYMGIPYLFEDYLTKLPNQNQKPAFLLNTFGMMQGKALKLVHRLVTGKGFRVFAAHTLQMPESFPPFIAKGWGGEDQPGDKQMDALKCFISNLSDKLQQSERGTIPQAIQIRSGLLNSIMGVKSREKIRKEIGGFRVDAQLCSKCGQCAEICPYEAISMESNPNFDTDKCWGCWRCFNRCPQKAIHTGKIKGVAQYPGPSTKLMEKLTT